MYAFNDSISVDSAANCYTPCQIFLEDPPLSARLYTLAFLSLPQNNRNVNRNPVEHCRKIEFWKIATAGKQTAANANAKHANH